MKRKTMKGILGVVLSAVFAFICIPDIGPFAAEALQIGIDGYEVEDGDLKIYLNQNQGSGFTVTPDSVKATLGVNELTTDRIQTFAEANEPVSYKCVVDVSGSMSQQRIDEAKDIIKKIAEIKKPEDKVAITAMGNELVQSGYMTDPSEIAMYADYLTLTKEDTNLYYAIVEEIKGLQTSDEASGKKCLIFFSDGADDQAGGITRTEAEDAVKDGVIPVYTVGLLKNANKESDKEMAKILGSFARLSPGGIHYAPAIDGSDTDSIAQGIKDSLDSSLVLYENLDNVEISGKEVALKVSVSSQFGETATDTLTLPESDIKIIKQEIERIKPTPEVIVVEAPVEEKAAEPEVPDVTLFNLFGFMVPRVYVYVGAGLILLLAALLIVLIISLNKRKEETYAYNEGADYNNASYSGNDAVTVGGFNNDASSVTMAVDNMQNEYTGSVTVPATSALPKEKTVSVTLVRMGRGNEKNYSATVGSEKYSIGRSATASKLAFPDDTALSGEHCSLVLKDKRLFIRDEKSTNGTFVNGVPIEGQFELNQDDVILIGSYEYRISWK